MKWKNFISNSELGRWLHTLFAPCMGSLVTGLLGYLQNIPWIWIFLGVLGAFVLVFEIRYRMQSFTDKEKVKLEAFLDLYASLYVTPTEYEGDKSPYFNALNKARAIFQESEEVTSIYNKLIHNPGHEGVVIPELIAAMGKEVSIDVNLEQVKRPIGPYRKQKQKQD